MSNAIGATVKMLRKAHDMTLADLANAIDMSVSYLSDVERGRTNPSYATLHRLAGAFDCSIAMLIGIEEGGDLLEDEKTLIAEWRRGNYAQIIRMALDKIEGAS